MPVEYLSIIDYNHDDPATTATPLAGLALLTQILQINCPAQFLASLTSGHSKGPKLFVKVKMFVNVCDICIYVSGYRKVPSWYPPVNS